MANKIKEKWSKNFFNAMCFQSYSMLIPYLSIITAVLTQIPWVKKTNSHLFLPKILNNFIYINIQIKNRGNLHIFITTKNKIITKTFQTSKTYINFFYKLKSPLHTSFPNLYIQYCFIHPCEQLLQTSYQPWP